MLAVFLGDDIRKLPWHGCAIIAYDGVVIKVEDKGPLASGIIREGSARDLGLVMCVRNRF
jgi:hypothetical protein